MLIPNRLKIGDTLGIITPSSGIDSDKYWEQFKLGKKILEELGFKLIESKHFNSMDPMEKAFDLHDMFSRDDIQGIICANGGLLGHEVLPFIDWKIIKDNPKIFLGFSDITTLHNAIHTKTGLVTFHSVNVKSIASNFDSEYLKEEFIKRLVECEIGEVSQNGERKTIRAGNAQGNLVGGNLSCLLKLADTEFWLDFTDSILILEEYLDLEEKCKENLLKLKNLDVFEKINGLIIGHNHGMQDFLYNGKQIEELVLEMTSPFRFPILKVNDFGHKVPQTVLPIGALVRMDAERKKYEIVEHVLD